MPTDRLQAHFSPKVFFFLHLLYQWARFLLLQRDLLSWLHLFIAIAGITKDYLSIIKDPHDTIATTLAIEMQYVFQSENRVMFDQGNMMS